MIVGALATILVVGVVVWALDLASVVNLQRREIQSSAEANCQQGEECGPKDLRAQVRVADATETLVDLTIIQAVVSVLGTIAVGATLALSVAATRAATRAVEIAEDTASRELRAYVTLTVDSFDINYLEAEPHLVRFRMSALIGIENFGATPGFDLRFGGWVSPATLPIPDENIEMQPTAKSIGTPAVAGRRDTHSIYADLVMDKHGLTEGHSTVYVAARITYQSLGEAHATSIHIRLPHEATKLMAARQPVREQKVIFITKLCEMT